MNSNQIRDRDAIMARLWSVEDGATTDTAPEVQEAARSAVAGLENILPSVDAAVDPLETARTYRYLGDAYFSMSAKTNQAALSRARQAYLRGESLLGAGADAVEGAKLNFNCANTTRLLEDGRNLDLLVEARKRYNSALQTFTREMPGAVSQVQSSLESLEVVIRGAELYAEAEQRYEAVSDLRQRLEEAGDDQAQVGAGWSTRAKPEDHLQRADDFIASVLPLIGGHLSPEEQEQVTRPLNDLKKEWDKEPTMEADLSAQVLDLIKQAQASGEIGAERQETLAKMFNEFMAIYNGPTDTLEQMAAKQEELRALIARYKDVLINPELGQP